MEIDQIYQDIFFQPMCFGPILGVFWQGSLIFTVVGFILRGFPSAECFVLTEECCVQHLGHQLWKALAWGGSPRAHPEPLMPSGGPKLLFFLLRSLLRWHKRGLSPWVKRSTNKSHEKKEWRIVFRSSLHRQNICVPLKIKNSLGSVLWQ